MLCVSGDFGLSRVVNGMQRENLPRGGSPRPVTLVVKGHAESSA